MKKWIEDLLKLQEVDMRIRSLNARLVMIPSEIKKLDAEIEAEKKKIHDEKEIFLKSELEIKKIESSIGEKNNDMRRIQGQSVMVKKNEEYKALLNEIENVKRKIGDFETEELILMEKIQAEKNKLKNLEAHFKEREKNIAEEKKELEDAAAKLKAEIARIQSGRAELESIIEPGALSIYSRILSRGNSSPLVQINQNMCGNCHLKLTPQTVNTARKEVMTLCDNCSHLLYVKD